MFFGADSFTNANKGRELAKNRRAMGYIEWVAKPNSGQGVPKGHC